MKDAVGSKTKFTRRSAILLTIIIILSSYQMVSSDSWPMFLNNPENTGNSTSKAPLTNDTLWTAPGIGGNGYSSPAIANGRVFVNRGGSGTLYSLWASNGTEIWNQAIGNDGYRSSSPAVYQGKVYVVGDSLYCFYENNGTQIWSKPLSGNGVGTSSPTVAEGKVFVFTQTLYCFYADNGTEIWNKDIGGTNGYSTPAVSGGKVFVNGGNFNFLYCLFANNGTEVWNISGGGFANSPVIYNGKVFFNPSNFYCLFENNGTEIWNRSGAGDGYSSPAAAFGKVYVHTTNRVKCYYENNGTIAWNVRLEDGSGSSSPVVSATGNIYVLTTRNSAGGVLYCLDGETGDVIWNYVTGGNGYSTGAIANDTLIVNDGILYCFGNLSPKTDYILIRDGPDGTGNNLCDPANYLTYSVGETVTLYGAAYNYSEPGDGFIVDAPIFLNWFSGNSSLATTTPTGLSSTVTLSSTNWGDVIITLDDNNGHQNTTLITILEPTSDYVLIRDQGGGGGTNLCDPVNYPYYPRGFSTTFYGALYNTTAGYIDDVLPSSTWSSDNISLVEVSSPGTISNLMCNDTNFGPAEITLTQGGFSNTTIITVLSATIDYVQIRDAPLGGGIDLGDPVNYPSYPVGYTTTFYAAAYNGSDFLSDIPVAWLSSNSTILDIIPSGSSAAVSSSSQFNGTATVSIDAGGGLTNSTNVTILPPEVDYLHIRSAPIGSGLVLSDPLNYTSYAVGQSDMIFGARYNLTSGYLDEVPVTSTWTSSDYDIVDVLTPGTSSILICNNSNFGSVTITLNDGEGHEVTTVIEVLEPSVDYLQIRDAPGGEGNISLWDNFTLEEYFAKKYYAAAFNFTSGYIGERLVNWTLVGDIGSILPNSGYSTNFTAINEGSGTLFANYTNISNSTIISVDYKPDIIMTPPVRLKVEVVEGGGALNLSWDPYLGVNFAGYKVYRSEGSPSFFELVNTQGLILENNYIDTGLINGVTYYYFVTAVDNATVPNESEPSLMASNTPKGEEKNDDGDFTLLILLLIIIIIFIILLFLIIKRRKEPKIISKTFVEMEKVPITHDETEGSHPDHEVHNIEENEKAHPLHKEDLNQPEEEPTEPSLENH
jgi:outer membrane protein assembly factor BamB